MITNACYGRFGLFLHKTQRKTFFGCGREAISVDKIHIHGMILLNMV